MSRATAQRYPWKRFWYPREYRLSLFRSAFLPDPGDDLLAPLNPEVVPFEALGEVRCLVLLGEAGMGKSYEIDGQCRWADAQFRMSGGRAALFRLHEFTESQLSPELFGSEEVQKWRRGSHRLHLFLDSFDELQASVPGLADVLARKIAECPTDRLYLRIASRGADWPLHLEDRLKSVWGPDAVKVYQIAPLREADVAVAASQTGIEPQAFLRAVRERDISALASRPVTLAFLLSYPAQQKPLPESRETLFTDGCYRLCTEENPHRRPARLEPMQRLWVAGRIAAAMLFGGKAAIRSSHGVHGAEPRDLLVEDVCDGANADAPVPPGCLPVSREAVEETLRTALFVSQGAGRMGWSHQAYGEFLAGWYVKQRGATPQQVMSLVQHPEDPDGRIVPQLHEVAAWLATMVPGVLDHILAVDPVVLLGSDMPLSDDEHRAKLAQTVLGLVERGGLNDSAWGLAAYRNISHPGLAAQLEPYLVDHGRRARIRHTAAWAATACELREVQTSLLSIALDPSEDPELRPVAAWSLRRIGDQQTKARLLPLAFGRSAMHVGAELRSYALEALWPDHITTAEALTALEQYPSGQFADYLVERLPTEDLPLVLEWLEARDTEGLPDGPEGFADEIAVRAFAHVEDPETAGRLAAVCLGALRRTGSVLRSRLRSEHEKAFASQHGKRRALLSAMLPSLTGDDVWHLCEGQPALVTGDDAAWLVDRLLRTTDEAAAAVLVGVLRHLALWRSNPAAYEAVLSACRGDSRTAALFSECVQSMPLDHPTIRAQHYRDLRRRARTKRWQRRHGVRPRPAEALPDLLDRAESGDAAAAADVMLLMARDAEGQEVTDWASPDVTRLPGWQTADRGTRVRILKAARTCAEQHVARDAEWHKKRAIPYAELAGYRALRLLLKEDETRLAMLPVDRWRRWVPAILCCPDPHEQEEGRIGRALAVMAYQHVPEAVARVLRQAVRRESRRHPQMTALVRLRECAEDCLVDAVLAELRRPGVAAVALEAFLTELVGWHIPRARRFAEALISTGPSARSAGPRRGAAGAIALLRSPDAAAWRVVWSRMSVDQRFGRTVVTRLCPGPTEEAPSFLGHLTMAERADLFVWLARNLGIDPKPFEPGSILRQHVLNSIVHGNSWEACRELGRVLAAVPEASWLRWHLQEAEENARRARWTAPGPRNVLELVHGNRKRLVRNGRELLDALLDSLTLLQEKLREKGRAVYLWEERPCKPKGERAFARYIRDHLVDDLQDARGVLVDCEVEIRLRQRLDILVRALGVASDGTPCEVARAVIEVKGNWHPQVEQAIGGQLVARYMVQNGCQHGLYVVGCFNCGRWDGPADARRWRASARRPAADLRCQLTEQALALSVDGRDVRSIVLDVGLSF